MVPEGRYADVYQAEFMQGIVTNDVAALEDQSRQPIYAALLNAQGRFLHDLFLHTEQGKCTMFVT